MTQHRKRRGAKTAAFVAEWFRSHGWPYATDTGAGRPGRDIENMPGLAPEVKGRRDFQPLAWLRQAESNAGKDLPFVVFRPDGMGPESIDRWPVLLRLSDFTELLREAGYGDRAEYGRRLASEREDLIAQGVDPNDLIIPLHPDPPPNPGRNLAP